MRERCKLTIAVVAAISASLSSLTVLPTVGSGAYSLGRFSPSTLAIRTARFADGTAGLIQHGRHTCDGCALPEGVLESRNEEEVESAEAILPHAVALGDLDDSVGRPGTTGAGHAGRHLAWNPSAHAFSPSIHPIRC